MSIATNFSFAFQQKITAIGEPLRIRYFNEIVDNSDYDNVSKLYQSGNDLWISGIVDTIDSSTGGADYKYIEQGKILVDDRIVYLNGSITTTGLFRIGTTGSPPTAEYSVIPNGIINYDVQGTNVYKKLYIRQLTTGSLQNEI